MQVNTINNSELAELLEHCKILTIVEFGSTWMYVLQFGAEDILVFADPNNDAFVVYPPDSFDWESGGGIHDIARAEGGEDGQI